MTSTIVIGTLLTNNIDVNAQKWIGIAIILKSIASIINANACRNESLSP